MDRAGQSIAQSADQVGEILHFSIVRSLRISASLQRLLRMMKHKRMRHLH